MSDKNKNRKRLITDFFRYHRNELTGEERNSFERELQKDPLAEEATEGFASISPEELSNDISKLQNRLKTRTTRRQKFMVYRIAASIAILMMISTIFIFIGKNKTGKNLADNSVQPQTLEIKKSQPVPGPVVKDEVSENQVAKAVKKTGKSVNLKMRTEPGKSGSGIEKLTIVEKQKNDSVAEFKDQQVEINVAAENIAAPPNAMVRARSSMESKRYETKADSTGYTPPTPSNGKSEFEKYIRDNLHRPDSATKGQRVVVVLTFVVLPDGSIDSIKIIRSPGILFSDEAIRVIKAGPSWKPAEESGKKIKDEVKVRIVFR
jgi:TonB family protein